MGAIVGISSRLSLSCEAQGITMNSHALFSMVSTCNLVQCRGINNPALSLISPSHYKLQRVTTMTLQAGSTQPLPLVSSNSVSLSRFLSGQSLRLTPLHQKEAFVKKASIKLRIVKAEATSPAQPEKPCPENAPKADVEVTKAADGAQKLKIGVYFAVWWSLNVVFNIYNKKVLNVYPFPWLTSTLSLAAGSAIMLVSWALKIVEAPQVDCDFWKGLAPVSVSTKLFFSSFGSYLFLFDVHLCAFTMPSTSFEAIVTLSYWLVKKRL